MFYNEFKAPAIIKTGSGVITHIDDILHEAHLHFEKRIIVTQKNLYEQYYDQLDSFGDNKIIIQGGSINEIEKLSTKIKESDALIFAFGGGSVLDSVKYAASRCDTPYITIPSTLSNDAIYSAVSRLTVDGKKKSFGVQPPIGIIVDFDIIKKSPKDLILAGIADLVSNLSAIQDWRLAHKMIGEPINELSFMLAKEAALPMFQYREADIFSDRLLFDLTNGLITSGLSMIVSGNTRGTSGAEHMISHAIDEFFPERSTIHGIQVGWAHLIIERNFREDMNEADRLSVFFEEIGLLNVISQKIGFSDEEFKNLVPYARKIRDRYTVFNAIK